MRGKNVWAWALVSIPVWVFYGLHAYWLTNTPMQDDFDALLQPATEWAKQVNPSFRTLWRILSVQDDERRIIADRLVAIGISKGWGFLDLRVMKTIGVYFNLILLGIFVYFVRARGWSVWTLAPVVLMMFSQANYNALHWGMIPVQQIGVFVWGLTALWFLSRGQLCLAVIFGLFSLASDVSGVLVWPAGVVTLVLQRSFPKALVWGILLGGAVWAYLHGLEVPSYRPSLADNLKAWPDMVGMLWIFPVLVFDVALDASLTFRVALLAVLATGVWIVFGRLFVQRVQGWFRGEAMSAPESWVLGSLAMLVATALVFIFGRASEGIAAILDSRYRHIYHLVAIFLWLLALLYFRLNAWVKPISLVFLGWHVGVMYFTWGYIDFHRQVQLTDMYAWHHQRAMPATGIYWRLRREVDAVIEEAEAAGIYRPAEFPFEPLAQAPITGQKTARWINVSPQGQGLEVLDIPRGNGKDEGVYAILRSSTTSYILPIRQQRSSSWRGFLPGRYYQPHGQSIQIQHQMMQPGTYQVLVGQRRQGQWQVYDTQLVYEPTLPAGGYVYIRPVGHLF